MYFKRTLLLLVLVLVSGIARGQILIPDETPHEEAPQSEVFGVKSKDSQLDLQATDWLSFQKQIHDLEKTQQRNGIAYIISGGLVLIGSTLGYASVDNSLERSIYSLSQTLSVAAIGYGVHHYNIGSGERSFYSTVEGTRSLTLEQKNELLSSYLAVRKQNRHTNRWIHFSTYATISALNFVQASGEKDKDLKNAMYMLGGITALAAISVHF